MEPKRIYFSNLDGLRFFCFISVFFFHSFATSYDFIKQDSQYWFVKTFLFSNGNLGVNFFFVLSGFLITYLLATEKRKYNKIDIPKFYARRILRIWPLFFFCVFFGFYVFPFLKTLNGEAPNESANILYYLTFLNNFDFIKKGLPDASMLGVLWSVAVEEQFYFVWPLLLSVTPARYWRLLLGVIILVSFIFRLFNAEDPIVLEHHTLSCISDMTIGGLAAVLITENRSFKKYISEVSKYFWICVYIITVCVFLWRKELFSWNDVTRSLDRLIISALFALIILEQCFAKRALYQMSDYKFFSKLGTYTYGLYCLHFFGILLVAKLLARLGWNNTVYKVLFLEGTLSLFITILLAFFSYRYFETPFLRLKESFAKVKSGNKIDANTSGQDMSIAMEDK